MAQQIDIVANLLMKVDGAEAGINKLKSSLSKLKMPEGLENSFKKSFANLDTLFAKYKSQVEKGFDTKGDVTAFNKTSKALDAELTRISKHFTELTGKEINFKVKSDDIIRTEKELEKLIEQKAQLSKESLKFEIKGGKDGFKDVESILSKLKEAAGRTKTGENIGGALDFLKSGDVQTAISLLEKASVSVKRFKQEKQDAFKSETGFDMNSILTTMISMLSGAEGKFGDVNAKIVETKNNLTNFQAEQLQKAGNYAEELSSKMENSASEIRQADGAMQDFARSSQSMSQQLGDLQQSTQYFFSLRNMINLFKRGVDEAIQSVKELDAAMTETAVVTDYKVSDMWNMLPQYTQLANQLGATTQGAYETMTLYFQQGLDQQQAFELGAETMKMARIAGLDYAETTDMMTAALRGFNMELNETSAKRVNDVYSELAAITASDTEELGTAMQRTASIAHSAGSSFEGTTAFLAQAIETTREPAENIGTAMKTIIARFQEMKKNPLEISEVEGEEVDFNKIDAALKSIGVDLVDTNGQFRDFDKVMLEISQKWDTLSQSQQRYIATTAAGSRQQSRFIAMVSDYDRTMQLMEAANNSAGASDEQFGKTMDSLESKLNKLHNAWQQFTMGIANNGMIKFAVDGITKLISGINDLIDTFSFGSGIIKSFLSLFTAFTGLKAGGKIINSLIGGLGGLVDPTSTFGAGFGRGMTGNRQAVNAAQAAAIYQPIVRAIYDTSQREIQNENAQNKTGAYDQYNAFKKANQDIRGLTSKQYTSKGLINELNQYDKITQRNLMRGLAGTELATTQSLMNRYRAGGVEVFKGIGQTKSELRGKRNAGYISDADFFNALYDPQELLKHVDSSNGPGAAAKAYLEKISGEIESQAENSAIQNHISNLLEEGISQVDIDAFKQSDDFKKATEAERQRILSKGDQGRENKGATKVLDKIGAAGAGVSQFGMAIQGFSSLLMSSANPAIQTFGSLLNSVGTGISSLGMGISGLTSAFTAISGSNFITGITGAGTALGGLGVTANMLTGGLMLLVGVIAGVALAIKKHRDNIKENAEKVTTDYKEKNEKHQSNISNLESYREDFARLSAGVDSNGMNISLDTADYERYLEITKALADINPDIVDGYNAQGNAIINNKNALEDTLAIEKERQAEVFDTYTSSDSTDTLIKARNLSRQERRGEANPYGGQGESYQGELLGGYEFAPQADMRKQAKKIGQTLSKGVKEGWISENVLSDFDIKIDDLAKGTDSAISAFEQNYDKVKARISSKMDSAGDELKDSTKESMLDAFSGYNEAVDELDELITPLYEQTLAKVGKEIQVPAEFKSFLNQGIKDIVSDANITDIDGEIAKLTSSFSALGKEGSEYSKILADVEKAQDDYAASLDANAYDEFIHGSDGAIERIRALKDELLKGVDTSQGYGKAISEFLENEVTKIEDFTKAGAANLQQALNTMTSEIEAAEGALENFNAIAEGSTYGKAASNMSQIYETATADEHVLAEGDQVFWAGAEAIIGRKNLLEGEGTNRDKALKQMKEVQEMLKGGQEGWDNFKIKWFDSADAKLFDDIKGLKLDDSGWISEIDESINPQVYDQIADALNMSKESLVAMLNLGRQFGEVDFTNISDVRKALATSENTIKNSDNGKVFVRKEFLESDMTSAGIDLNKQQEIERDLQKKYNTELIKSADEISKTNNQFAEMGITSMESLVKTFDDTGQFTKDEIQAYAEKFAEINGEGFNQSKFDEYWQKNQEDSQFGGIPSSLDSIQSILSSIESILASQRLSEGYLDNTTAQQTKDWLLGGKGQDTDAQYYWKGKGSNGEDITASQYNKTSKELDDFINSSEKYVAELSRAEEAARARGDAEEANKIKAEREAYDTEGTGYIDLAKKYRSEGQAAYESQIQSALDGISKDKEVIQNGLSEIFGKITPDQINTDAAQSTLNQLYEAAINNTPTILTDGIMTQMQNLGIDIQKAIDAGLVVDTNGVYAAGQEAGAEAGNSVGQGAEAGASSASTGAGAAAAEVKGKESVEKTDEGAKAGAESASTEGGAAAAEEKAREGLNAYMRGLNSAKPSVTPKAPTQAVEAKTSFDNSAVKTGVATINNMSAKIKVGADTQTALSTAESARKTIDSKTATINVSTSVTGQHVDIYVTKHVKEAARGLRNHGYVAPPLFGSMARGNYGQLGPKGKGGLTLTGELGYEIAWLPSENRSIILGVKGPQMINLPGDAIVWDHEQSEKIVKQKAIPAGSHYVRGKGATDPRNRYYSTGSRGGSGSTKSKNSGSSKSKASNKQKNINNFSIEEVIRFDIDQTLAWLNSELDRRGKDIENSLKKIGNVYDDITDDVNTQLTALKEIAKNNQDMANSYQRQLKALDTGSFKQVVSWTNANGKSQENTYDLSKYVYRDAAGVYKIDTDKIKTLGSNAEREAVFKAVNSTLSSLQSGLIKAQEAVDNANDQMTELANKVSETFYQWRSELTEIYDLTQRINDEISFSDRFTSQVELELSKLNAGFGDTAQSIKNIRAVLSRNVDNITRQVQDQQQMITARQTELNNMLSSADEQRLLTKYQNMTGVNAQVKAANVQWAQDQKTIADTALKYVSNVYKDLDRSVRYTIDWNQFNLDQEANPYNKETYESIKKYLDDLNNAATEFNNSIKEQTDFIKQTYDALHDYQDYIADMEDTLIKGVEEEIEEAKNNAKELSDSITNALKDLLDEVKRKLDERRKQEDNAKTERDISQKQQRLAALRADTAGGHQVEIAQLEKEIADAQQSYQRTLEDQLLDKLQQQADAAAEQRERQIELMEAGNQIDASTNKELVDLWLKNPQAYKEEIRNAWLEANGYDEKGEAGQYVLEQAFESGFAELVTAVEQSGFNNSEQIFTAIEGNTNTLVALLAKLTDETALEDVTERNTETLESLTKNLAGAQTAYKRGIDTKTLKDLGFSAKDLSDAGYTPGELKSGGYTAQELYGAGVNNASALKGAGYSAADLKDLFNPQELKDAGYTAKQLKDAGVETDLNNLKQLGYGAKDLKDAGFGVTDLKNSGYGLKDLKNAGFSATDLKKAGFTAKDFGANGVSYAEAKSAGFTALQLKGISQYASQAKKELQNIYQQAINAAHKAGTVTAKSLKDVITKADNAGYSRAKAVFDLAEGDAGGGVTWKEVAAAAKAAKYTKAEVKKWRPSTNKNNAQRDYDNAFKKYKIGGLADYTGPAWLDGTPSKPELVLNPTDTKNFLALRDVLSSAMKSTGAVNNSYGGDAMYEININVDHLNNDYDVDKVAERVKKIIVKDAGYRNVTQVRNLR